MDRQEPDHMRISLSPTRAALIAAFAMFTCAALCRPAGAADEPVTAEAFDARGALALDKGAFDSAISDFTAAIALKSDDAVAYTKRGWAYDKKGELALAIADFGQAIEIDPAAGDAYYGRGRAYLAKRDYKQAIADSTKAASLKPSFAMAYVTRAYAYASSGEMKKAMGDAKKACKASPAIAGRVWRDLGWIRYNAADFKSAAQCFGTSLSANGEDTATQFNLGLALAASGDWDAAEPEYVAAIAVATRDETSAALARAEEAARRYPDKRAILHAVAFLQSSPRR
jgi:tetratricopeptide (TPR) repeat protein